MLIFVVGGGGELADKSVMVDRTIQGQINLPTNLMHHRKKSAMLPAGQPA